MILEGIKTQTRFYTRCTTRCTIITNYAVLNVQFADILLGLKTFYGMVSCGITRRKPISLQRLFLRASNARKPMNRPKGALRS